MPVKIEFATDGAAFADDREHEIFRVLRSIGDQLQTAALVGDLGRPFVIRDSNGNTIGRWEATIDAEQEESET